MGLSAANLDRLTTFFWAVAIFHAQRHDWHGFSPLQALPGRCWSPRWRWSFWPHSPSPQGALPVLPPVLLALIYVGLVGGPVAIWAATSVSHALPTLVSSLGFLGAPLVGVIVSTL
jgi:hypothetical protein